MMDMQLFVSLEGKFAMKFRYLLLLAIIISASQAGAQTITLGAARRFAVLGSSTVTSTGATTVSGHVGVSPGSSVTGMPPGAVTLGSIHAADPVSVKGHQDLAIAYNAIVAMVPTTELTGQNLGGMTLPPGVYHFNTSAQLSGALTLDARNDPNAVFVFQIGSTLTTAPNSAVFLINGGNVGNIYWQVASSATLNTGTAFMGSIVAFTSITLNTGTTILPGRALALNGGVTMDTNNIATPGFADILFQNSNSNQVSAWSMQGTVLSGISLTTTVPAAGYFLRGSGDFNGDGSADLVFQNSTTGQIVIWFMKGSTYIGGQLLAYTPASGYQVVGVGDFNGDGKPDIVFQNSTSGQIAVWYFNGTQLIGYDSTQFVPAAGYKVVGVGDFNGDGKADLVFQNSTSGAVVFWFMNGAQFQSGAFASARPDPSFKVVGVNDYNNDGLPDLVFQNTNSGQLAIWYMNGSVLFGGGVVNMTPSVNNIAVGPR